MSARKFRSEHDLRVLVGKSFERAGAHVSWIESPDTSAGFADMDLCHTGTIFQIELKIVKPDNTVRIRPTQFAWFRDRVRAGGAPILWIGHPVDGTHCLVPGCVIANPYPIRRIADVAARPHLWYTGVDDATHSILGTIQWPQFTTLSRSARRTMAGLIPKQP